jgi:hypothetical protein
MKYQYIELLTADRIPISFQHIANLWQSSSERSCLSK